MKYIVIDLHLKTQFTIYQGTKEFGFCDPDVFENSNTVLYVSVVLSFCFRSSDCELQSCDPLDSTFDDLPMALLSRYGEYVPRKERAFQMLVKSRLFIFILFWSILTQKINPGCS